MTSWRDNLWPASFRSVNFQVFSSDTTVGRRNIVHQYPFQDNPYVEDLGGDADEFIVEAFVIQNNENNYDYFAERDRLIQELKKAGPGTLIHPFLGSLTVSLVGKASIKESFDEGGIARFSMTFVRAEKDIIPYPKQTIDHINAVDLAVENAQNDMVDGFGDHYDAEDAPAATVESIEAANSSLNKMMRSAMKVVQGLGPAKMAQALAALSEQYLGINIYNTCATANGLIGMFNGLASLSGIYGDVLVSQLFGACSSAIRGISSGPMSGAKVNKTPTTGFQASTMSEPALIDENLGKTIINSSLVMNQYGEESGSENISSHGGTLERKTIINAITARESANIETIINITRLSAITTAAQTAIRIDYSSYNSAIETMTEITDAIDDLLLKLGNDAENIGYSDYNISISDPLSYEALRSLRPIFVNAMIGVGADLARIINYKVPAVTLPSIVLAYEKYEDLDREQEIIARNIPLVQNPAFLPQGKELEILNE